MNNFAWAAKMHFYDYLALHKCILAVLKVCTNTDTTKKKAYTCSQPA